MEQPDEVERCGVFEGDELHRGLLGCTDHDKVYAMRLDFMPAVERAILRSIGECYVIDFQGLMRRQDVCICADRGHQREEAYI